jgi:hypothetical protein
MPTESIHRVDHYAYQAEAALAHYTHAQWTQHDGFHCERLSCVLYARAARCALNALLSAQGGNPDAGALNLLAAVACLDQRGRIFGRNLDKVQLHARQLSRALILDQSDAGAGYVTRDLFDQADVETCAAAATFFVDLCCRRLLRATYEQALVRFHPFRQPPMTDTTLWQRRHPSGRPGDKQSRRSS